MYDSSNLTAPLVADTRHGQPENDATRDEQTKAGSSHPSSPESDKEFLYRVSFSKQTYYMMRPIENMHIYLWILKDLAWSQDWYYPALIFGTLALAWCAVLFYEAYALRSLYEAYMAIATTLWLAANFVWMAGEVFNNDDDDVAPKSAIMMEVAIAWILAYYCILKPLKILKTEARHTERFNSIGLRSRFPYFENWREYEHLHTLLWLCKDLSWDLASPFSWVVFIIPTFLIALDFIWMTWSTHHMFIDCSHYVAQLLWVTGNATWAMGQLFTIRGNDDSDDRGPYSLWHASSTAVKKLRWWSSVVLFVALVPIFFLYLIWLPMTAVNWIKAAEIPENAEVIPLIPCNTSAEEAKKKRDPSVVL